MYSRYTDTPISFNAFADKNVEFAINIYTTFALVSVSFVVLYKIIKKIAQENVKSF